VRRAVVLAALAACSQKAGEPNGIGKYRFSKLTLGALKDGRCQPEKLSDGRQATWCFALTPFKIANRNTEVAAYFLGVDDNAPLIEVQLTVRGCVENDLDQWLRTNYGIPFETKSTKSFWKNSFMFIAATMPSEPGRCFVQMLPVAETSEIARLRGDGSASGSGSGSGSAAQ